MRSTLAGFAVGTAAIAALSTPATAQVKIGAAPATINAASILEI